MRGSLRMPRLPTLQARQRVFFVTRAPDLDEREFLSALRGLHAWRLRRLPTVMRWPRRIAQALPLEQLEQAFERAGVLIDRGMQIAQLLEAGRHRSQREIRRIAVGDFIPRERR